MTPTDLYQSWTTRCPVQTQTLPPGTLLYHGTACNDFDETQEQLYGPAWVSDSESVARVFAGRNGGDGPPRVVVYRLVEPVVLPLITSSRDIEQLADVFGLSLAGVEEMRSSVEQANLPGWWIPSNYPDGADILLTSTGSLEYVGTRRLAEDSGV